MSTIYVSKHTAAKIDEGVDAGLGAIRVDIAQTLTPEQQTQGRDNLGIEDEFNAKQDTLVSGTNIKTVNGESILGAGDLEVESLPAGGTTGQVLTKKSATEGDAEWTTPSSGVTDHALLSNLDFANSGHTGFQAAFDATELADIASISDKVDKVVGKELSSNDYTDVEKAKLAGLSNYDDTAITADIATKVDKVAGKVLSSNDYTDAEKTKLAGLSNYDDSAIEAEIATKVDKIAGKVLSSNDYTDAEKAKLAGLSNYDDTTLEAEIATKVDKVAGKELSTNDYTDADQAKLAGLSNFDPSTLDADFDAKVDKVAGKQLSTEDFTTAEKTKLAGLESPKFKGQYTSLAALQATTGEVGSYAYVDEGAGSDVINYIWDTTNSEWIAQQGESSAMTPAQVKSSYESNPDTNAFTDAEKTKLSGLSNYDDTAVRGLITGLDTDKVDKEAGKGLSTNDYTTVDKAEVAKVASKQDTLVSGTSIKTINGTTVLGSGNIQIDGVTDHSALNELDYASSGHTGFQASLSAAQLTAIGDVANKVDKVVGKELSTNDFTDAEQTKLASLSNFDPSTLEAEIDTKVDKVAGKGLSTEDYTTAEKTKLAGIEAGAEVNDTDVIKFTAQTLTEAEKTQALTNIGATTKAYVDGAIVAAIDDAWAGSY